MLRSREAVDMLSAVQSGADLGALPCFLADPERSLVRLSQTSVALSSARVEPAPFRPAALMKFLGIL